MLAEVAVHRRGAGLHCPNLEEVGPARLAHTVDAGDAHVTLASLAHRFREGVDCAGQIQRVNADAEDVLDSAGL